MKKIYVSLFLALFLLCQCIMLPGAFATENNINDQDIELLVELDLLRGDETGDLRLDDKLMRSEYTALILRMMGYEDIVQDYAGNSSFKDVSSEHWARGYIQLATDLNLINGVGAELFEPDREVNFNEAIKIMVCALGYGPLADRLGGFPGGYIKQAAKLDLLKDISGNTEFLREDACSLIVNSLTVDIMDDLGTVRSGSDALSRYLDIEYLQGFVTGTEGVYSGKEIKNGYIEIEGALYKLRNIPEEELYGCELKFYLYSEDDDDKTVYYYKIIENDSRIKLDADDILETTTLDSLNYLDEDDDEETLQLAENTIIYYNGKKVGSAQKNKNLLMPKEGNVILCDKEEDGVYDLVIVYDYRTVVVNYVDENMIYDIYDKHINLKKIDSISIISGEESIDASELKPYDVISVAESLDGKRINIIADFEVKEGYIVQSTEEEDKTIYQFITTEGDEFEVEAAKSYQDAVDMGVESKLLVPDARIIRIRLDTFGNVAFAEILDAEAQKANITLYGFLVETDRTGSLGGDVMLKILTADNRFEVFTLKTNDKIYLGRNKAGSYVKSTVNAEVFLDAIGGKGSADRQLVQYRADEDGNLTQLFLPAASGTPNIISEDVSESFLNYRQGVLSQQYYMDDKTVVFSIPENAIYENVMSVGKYNNFFSEGSNKTCSLYDVNDGHVGAVVIHDTISITYASADSGYEMILNYASSPVLFINKSTKRVGEDGELYMGIDGYQNGKMISVNVSDDLKNDSDSSRQLKPGAVIHYENNDNSKSWAMTADEAEMMVVFEKVFDFNEDNGSGIRWDHDIIEDNNPDVLTLWGVLETIEPAYCSVAAETNGVLQSYAMQLMNNVTFLKYNRAKEEFQPITQHELAAGQKVYIIKQSGNQTIVVY